MENKAAKIRKLPLLFALAVLFIFTSALCLFTQPMKDVSLDLSLVPQDDMFVIDPENFDSKGWTVYTAEGETRTELIPDGFGGYTGLELGQTFYYSRTMEEELESPTLQIGTAEWTFSVWLDDALIYTDHPELDNRVGYLTLPMNEWVREEPIIISLPMDYQGKTLTIAQSSPPWMETSTVMAFPTTVRLYCGFAYESGLIAESYNTAIKCALAFFVGTILLGAFVRGGDWSYACISFAALCWMGEQLIGTSFYYKYFGTNKSSITIMIPFLSTFSLQLFLTMRANSHRKYLSIMNGIYLLSIVIYGVFPVAFPGLPIEYPAIDYFASQLPSWISLGILMPVFFFSWTKWRKHLFFHRIFAPLSAVFLAAHWLEVVFISEKGVVAQQLSIALNNMQITYLYHRILPGISLAAVLTAVAEAAKNEMNRRAEQQLIALKIDLAQASYENLTHQHEEVMMLRHDILRHLHTIRQMGDMEQIQEYLTDLIGQNERIRPVVQCGNKMLDILLNGKLFYAVDAGIHVDIQRIAVPEKLLLSDTDMCSLITNIIDNAIDAALKSKAASPFIRLDIHTRDGFLAIVCENSYDPTAVKEEKRETVPKHGLGLKIIRNIAHRYDGVLLIEEADCYRTKVVIPLG